jgi:hypothetical protein
MALNIVRAPDGSVGVDCVTILTPHSAAALKAAGAAFVVRYLGSLSIVERDAILGAGLGLMLVTFSRAPGWPSANGPIFPSAELGASDGASSVAQAKKLGLPAGVQLWRDFEGPPAGTTAEQTIAYVNAWTDAVVAAGYVAGLYVGFGIPLTPEQLYDLKVTAYWHSCSQVPEVAVRGYQMRQAYPPNQTLGGVSVDIDHVSADAMGDTPLMLVDAPDTVAA